MVAFGAAGALIALPLLFGLLAVGELMSSGGLPAAPDHLDVRLALILGVPAPMLAAGVLWRTPTHFPGQRGLWTALLAHGLLVPVVALSWAGMLLWLLVVAGEHAPAGTAVVGVAGGISMALFVAPVSLLFVGWVTLPAGVAVGMALGRWFGWHAPPAPDAGQ